MSQPAETLAEEHERIIRLVREHEQAWQGDKRQAQSIVQASEVARVILHMRLAGEHVSRRRLLRAELATEWRYSLALAMLRSAGLEAAPVRTLDELGAALATLDATSARLLAAGAAGFDELRSHATKRQERRRYVQAGA